MNLNTFQRLLFEAKGKTIFEKIQTYKRAFYEHDGAGENQTLLGSFLSDFQSE